MTDLFQQSFALFSEDKKHRLVLGRIWDQSKPGAMVIGLNPSTADGQDDDPTIGFVKRILNHNGYGSLHMLNLFTYITPKPAELIKDNMPMQAVNLWREYYCDNTIIFAWGGFKNLHGRDIMAQREFPNAFCFGQNKDESPRHPMFLSPNTPIVKFN